MVALEVEDPDGGGAGEGGQPWEEPGDGAGVVPDCEDDGHDGDLGGEEGKSDGDFQAEVDHILLERTVFCLVRVALPGSGHVGNGLSLELGFSCLKLLFFDCLVEKHPKGNGSGDENEPSCDVESIG